MSNKLATKQDISERLVKHLVEIEEDKDKFAEDYVYRSPRDRNKLISFFDNYALEIEKLLQNIDILELKENFPFIIIGSEITVEDMDSCEIFNLRIKNPLRDSIEYDDVSCLSPVGKALLLRKTGDEVSINTPGGIITYRIKDIKLHFL